MYKDLCYNSNFTPIGQFQIFPLLSLGYTFHTPVGSGHDSELATPHILYCLSAIPSHLMKSTVVDESLSSMNQQFCSRENQLLQLLQQNEKSTSRDTDD